jgi:hypothetical protein
MDILTGNGQWISYMPDVARRYWREPPSVGTVEVLIGGSVFVDRALNPDGQLQGLGAPA